ncbi:hypothetical protein CEE37_07800, partial [candidate division LCP-89 bacterium B3_LCP]
EFAVPKDILKNQDSYEKISKLSKQTNANLVLGSLVNTKEIHPDGRVSIWDSAFVFSRNGTLHGRYDSIMPFPFENDFISGDNLPIFEIDAGRFGITICYEGLYNTIYKQYSKSDVHFFISIANNEPVHDPHAMHTSSLFTRLRAAENRKYLIRATNTGITQVVNPYGKVIAKLKPNKEGILLTEIYLR